MHKNYGIEKKKFYVRTDSYAKTFSEISNS